MLVREKRELEHALDVGAQEIEVRGELAERLSKAVRLRTLSKWTLGLLSVSIMAMPLTGGTSGFAAASVAALTGMEVAVIAAIAFLGLALILMILKEYDIVDVSAKDGDREATVRLRKKKRHSDC